MVKNPEEYYKYYEDDPDEFNKEFVSPINVFVEDSYLYKNTGSLKNSDPLYKKIDETAFDDIIDLKVLQKYLTNEELKERLGFENYMLIETEKLIDDLLKRQKEKATREKISKLKREIKELEKKLTIPTVEDRVNKIVNDLTNI